MAPCAAPPARARVAALLALAALAACGGAAAEEALAAAAEASPAAAANGTAAGRRGRALLQTVDYAIWIGPNSGTAMQTALQKEVDYWANSPPLSYAPPDAPRFVAHLTLLGMGSISESSAISKAGSVAAALRSNGLSAFDVVLKKEVVKSDTLTWRAVTNSVATVKPDGTEAAVAKAARVARAAAGYSTPFSAHVSLVYTAKTSGSARASIRDKAYGRLHGSGGANPLPTSRAFRVDRVVLWKTVTDLNYVESAWYPVQAWVL